MLTKLRVKNFKAWRDSGEFRLAPLTVLFGTNSAGKSSLGHLLLGLKQTALSTDRKRAFHTGDEASLIDLGTFVECLHGHDPSATLEFELQWALDPALSIVNPLDESQSFSGSHLSLQCSISASSEEQPFVRRLRYALTNEAGKRPRFEAVLEQSPEGKVTLETRPLRLVHADGRKWGLEAPEKFYRVSDRSLARYKNADFLSDLALSTEQVFESLSYLGPLREPPRRTYGWSGNTPETVGTRGEYSVACILAARAAGRKLNRGKKQHLQSFDVFIAGWLEELGVIESFEVSPTAPGRKDYDVRVKTLGADTEVSLPDVGFGVSQVLPALVQSFYCPSGSIVWMEQPEIHLHPQVQSQLADAFIAAIHAYEKGRPRGVQLIIETHSEHFLNRVQRRIAEEMVTPEEVAIYFCKPGPEGAELEELQVDMFGEISNWPENFFGDEMAELVARSEAAARRRHDGSAP